MTTKQLTLTVHVDDEARGLIEKAAGVQGQTLAAFVEGAAEELARRVLLTWAVDRYLEGERSFGELAGETGLDIEQIMGAMEGIGDRDRAAALAALWDRTQDDATEMLLTSAASIARLTDDPELLRRAEHVAAQTLSTDGSAGVGPASDMQAGHRQKR